MGLQDELLPKVEDSPSGLKKSNFHRVPYLNFDGTMEIDMSTQYNLKASNDGAQQSLK